MARRGLRSDRRRRSSRLEGVELAPQGSCVEVVGDLDRLRWVLIGGPREYEEPCAGLRPVSRVVVVMGRDDVVAR